MPAFTTERLQMQTLTIDMMEAVSKGAAALEKTVPYKVSPEWPLDVYQQFFPYKIDRFRKFPAENNWEGVIIDKSENMIIGDMGFKGGPNGEGIVDIGYSIVPSYRGRGYATEMGKAMVEWALDQPDVKKVMASCDPDNIASIRTLEKIGFQQTITTDDSIYWLY
ncbi:GNAT family N-acetyltransferase [Sediminibacillus albus]|uniref:Ribosomal-protein-alanine N-acetyltransferase n=1 Tax=Sediminibacillus albus TaxID=407036 RepID=A0A1G8X747_9BACI|nr:GNAT family N-acetyltransferase [Sediminibacillus albus]SDJ85655.1 ribosomal-protein-alanine N-acetyltransferase [Sediminibacillus albus]